MKVSAAGAAGAAAFDWAVAEPAFADTVPSGSYAKYHTTCPYCSASCGQVVSVMTSNWGPYSTGDVIDIYGDSDSPINGGGLCAKGAGALQLVNNKRRIGAWTGSHPVNDTFAADTTTYPSGVAYMRTGNGPWGPVALDTALNDIAQGLVDARGTITSGGGYNSKTVAFFGCSHMNNEQNYLYRKLIANFGTTNTEHQARI